MGDLSNMAVQSIWSVTFGKMPPKELDKKNSKKKKEYYQLRYDLRTAFECGVHAHPQIQMQSLGYKLLGSVPQSIADCWWFTVDKIRYPLPDYLTEMEYDYEHWHGDKNETSK